LVAVKVGKKVGKKRRLMVEVFSADTGALTSRFVSPFQRRRYKAIRVSLRDSNGDGVPDQVVLTARKGQRTVTAFLAGRAACRICLGSLVVGEGHEANRVGG
jgi:hypothetical protein